MNEGKKPSEPQYSSLHEYRQRFFPKAKKTADLTLEPEEFGRKLAKEYAREYKQVIAEFLQENPPPKRQRK